MDLSKLSAADKRILYAAVGVIVGGIVGIIDAWGIFATLGLLGGLAAAFIVLQPQLAPSVKLPMPRATALFAAGAIAAGGFALAILTYLRYALDLGRIYTLLFDLGFIAALALAWFTWAEYKKAMPAASATSAATTPPSSAPPAA